MRAAQGVAGRREPGLVGIGDAALASVGRYPAAHLGPGETPDKDGPAATAWLVPQGLAIRTNPMNRARNGIACPPRARPNAENHPISLGPGPDGRSCFVAIVSARLHPLFAETGACSMRHVGRAGMSIFAAKVTAGRSRSVVGRDSPFAYPATTGRCLRRETPERRCQQSAAYARALCRPTTSIADLYLRAHQMTF